MLFLKILGITILTLFLLSLFPVRVYLAYKDNAFSVKIRYLFIKVGLFPTKDKKRKKKQKKTKEVKMKAEQPKTEKAQREKVSEKTVQGSTEKPKEKVEEEEKKKKTLTDRQQELSLLWDLAKSSKKALKIIKNHFVIDKLYAHILVGGEDAHETAVNFGNHSLIVTNGVAFLGEFFNLRLKHIGLVPDFLAQKTTYDASVQLFIRPFFVAIAIVHLGVALIKLYFKRPKNIIVKKGGRKHESAKSIK